jgi:hypothetical protein
MTNKAEETKKETGKETAFPLYQLREHSRELFNVKPEVFDGAFATAKEETITKSEAKSRINAFLKKGVK